MEGNNSEEAGKAPYPPSVPPQPSNRTTYTVNVPKFARDTPQNFGMEPQAATCPNCHQNIVTEVSHEPGLLTWILVGGLCLLGCWCGCQLIPLCVKDCKDVEHKCPNCNALVGLRKQLR